MLIENADTVYERVRLQTILLYLFYTDPHFQSKMCNFLFLKTRSS